MAGKFDAAIKDLMWRGMPVLIRMLLARIIHERSGLCDFPAAVQL
jgi:hypothetical protein